MTDSMKKGDDGIRKNGFDIMRKRNPHIHGHPNPDGTYTITTDLQEMGGLDKTHDRIGPDGDHLESTF